MYRFGSFHLDPRTQQLSQSGHPLKLEKIPFEILVLLIRHRGRIVTRDEIAEAVWGRDKFVEAADGINTAIRKIRRALDDSADEPRYIGTAVGRGYRFLAEVEEEAGSDSPPANQPTAPPPQSHRRHLLILLAASVILAAGLAVWLGFRHRQPAPTSKSRGITRITADNGFTGWPDLSPDGKLIAYASNRADPDNMDVYIQPVEGGSAIRLTNEPGHDFSPSISPKGDTVAFASIREPRGIYVVPIFGGPARLIAKGGTRPRYSPDGEWIAFSKADSSWIVPASGGEPRQLRPELSSNSPVWAGNDYLIFIAQNDKNPMDWWLTPRDGSWVKPLGVFPLLAKQSRHDFPDSWQSFRTPDYFDNGSVVFRVRTRDGANLWRIRFSPDWQPFPPQRVTYMTDHVREPTASATGRIAAAVVSRNIDVYELPLDADTATVRGKISRLTTAKTSEQFASITADGNLVSYTAWRKSDHGDQFLLDRRTGAERQLTATGEKEAHGRISPDGRFLIFGRWDDKGKASFHRMTIASGETERLCDDCEAVDPTPGGASFTFTDSPRKLLLIRDFSGGPATEPVHDDSLVTAQPSIAPDNRWITFVAFPRGDNDSPPKIFAAPFRRDGRLPKQQWIEIATGLTPLWSPNGQWIYFDDQHGSFRCLFARRFDPVAGKPTGPNVSIAHIHGDQQLIRSPQFKDRGLACDRIVFSTMEMLSNIWLLQ